MKFMSINISYDNLMSEVNPTHTCFIEIVLYIYIDIDICLEKIRGPGATYGGHKAWARFWC